MPYTYENVNPTLVENTTMKLMVRDGVPKNYMITPNEGYVLHDSAFDTWIDIDGNELTEPILGFRTTTATCPVTYDFVVNSREFYTVPADSVPADQIWGGGGNNDHEII